MEFRDVRAVLRVGFQQSIANKFSSITKGTFLTNEIISFITKLKGDCCDDSNGSLGFFTIGNKLRKWTKILYHGVSSINQVLI